ncbi:MAG TPA: hypothetical protein VF434_05420 [Promineifilum sp.]
MTATSASEATSRPRAAKWGWGILLGVSVLLTLAGLFWTMQLPEMLLENIAERTALEPDGFLEGSPSAFDVITLIARNFGAGYAALGLLALLVGLEGYRNGSRWAWTAMWVLVAAFTALAVSFTLAAGRVYGPDVGFLALAVITLAGLLLARKGLAQ